MTRQDTRPMLDKLMDVAYACYDEHYVDIGECDYDYIKISDENGCLESWELRAYSARLVDEDTFEPIGEYIELKPYIVLATLCEANGQEWIDYQYTEACEEIEKIIKGRDK